MDIDVITKFSEKYNEIKITIEAPWTSENIKNNVGYANACPIF